MRERWRGPGQERERETETKRQNESETDLCVDVARDVGERGRVKADELLEEGLVATLARRLAWRREQNEHQLKPRCNMREKATHVNNDRRRSGGEGLDVAEDLLAFASDELALVLHTVEGGVLARIVDRLRVDFDTRDGLEVSAEG